MNFNLKEPCSNCPFRKDKFFPLTKERVQDIVFSDGSFACHKTVDYSDESEGRVKEKSEHCAELLIMQEKMKAPNQTTRIAERLGLYDHKKLNMDAPVYDSVNDYLNEIDKQK